MGTNSPTTKIKTNQHPALRQAAVSDDGLIAHTRGWVRLCSVTSSMRTMIFGYHTRGRQPPDDVVSTDAAHRYLGIDSAFGLLRRSPPSRLEAPFAAACQRVRQSASVRTEGAEGRKYGDSHGYHMMATGAIFVTMLLLVSDTSNVTMMTAHGGIPQRFGFFSRRAKP